jgi:hypothetical protein
MVATVGKWSHAITAAVVADAYHTRAHTKLFAIFFLEMLTILVIGR